MSDEGLEELRKMFQDESGFGDSDARRNAEVRLQVLLAVQQTKILARQNWLTLLLVIVGFLQVLVLGYQVVGR